MYLLGIDIGSSSVKVCIIDAQNGKTLSNAFYPKQEAPIITYKAGWAEQNPESWWLYLKGATAETLNKAADNTGCSRECIKEGLSAVGISYQMHGLVCVDKDYNALRPSIIWCDSRAVSYGNKALNALGNDFCLNHLLNSPGNFSAGKLAWVKDNEPDVYEKIYKIMLPGDYIAMRLTGSISTTVSGLSEGIFWDFQTNTLSHELMDYYGFDESLIPEIRPTFSEQGRVTKYAANELGLKEGIPVAYRAGDQPNNALSLNVFNPGEIAATAGTSGVVYGVNDQVSCDSSSRVNVFAHVNHSAGDNNTSIFPSLRQTRLGVLLCINGTGILNSWVRRNIAPKGLDYGEMNNLAEKAPLGCDGLSIIPFGNGAERVLENKETSCVISGINFNIHNGSHILRAAQEGIAFSFRYGIDVMKGMGMNIDKIHAGNANMFLSPLFRETLSTVTGASIDLYETDGSVGAAKGAGIGSGIYKDNTEAFASLKRINVITPNNRLKSACEDAYRRWLEVLKNL